MSLITEDPDTGDVLEKFFDGRLRRYRRMPDGTHAEVVSSVAAPGRTPVITLLRPVGDAQLFTINTSVQTSAANAIAAGTVALRIQKSAGVAVRFRIVQATGGAEPTWADPSNTGQILLDDIVGLVDVFLPTDVDVTTLRVQVIRAAGNTGTGQFAFTRLVAA
jgi:hypothetical protein